VTGAITSKFQAFDHDAFVVVPGPVPPADLHHLVDAYDRVMREAAPDDVHHGSTTTRVNDLVNRGPEFDGIYTHPLLLEACHHLFTQSFKLSTVHARTLRPWSPPQKLHQDFPRDDTGWTMVGFILMIDDFRPENGATCFSPGSHLSPKADNAVPACGPAGAMIIYNGAVWHGHGANQTDSPRRSIQGAFIRSDLKSGFNLADRMRPETLARIGPLAKSLIVPDSR
jgi:ectoine hydroxylase-related dioxygenase (phytanoyl-CoA dioxygenase family)